MNQQTVIKFITVMIFFLVGCVTTSANSSCPDMQGSYKIEGSADLYIKRNAAGEYMAIVGSDDSLQFVTVITVDKDDLERENFPECSIILQGAGILIPSDKEKTYSVLAQSQNYTTERKPGTPFVLMVMSGFYSDAFGVDKTAATLPAEISERFSKGNAQ
ncbi:hypothetical protein [Type-D symbiont of Plautia stali]|uniref:hypothetical protein n=1 Tax=Type-D symbiont of Plautia stali TaxID=1560356 RepID=UPI00073F43C3|nr:hypothetical protein [Type-D symbiont of Plautia stali]